MCRKPWPPAPLEFLTNPFLFAIDVRVTFVFSRNKDSRVHRMGEATTRGGASVPVWHHPSNGFWDVISVLETTPPIYSSQRKSVLSSFLSGGRNSKLVMSPVASGYAISCTRYLVKIVAWILADEAVSSLPYMTGHKFQVLLNFCWFFLVENNHH